MSPPQLKAYQEDFDAERREKERLMVEKQNERLRLQAEITSLQLQLDRCRTELSHYSSEATRLAHQLKIRNQVEQEQYRRSPEDLVGFELAWGPGGLSWAFKGHTSVLISRGHTHLY